MKAEILKLAGVKNEKEFYKKFPTEQSFMAKYGKQLSKLQSGGPIPPAGAIALPTMPNVQMKNLATEPGYGRTKLDEVTLQNKTAATITPEVASGVAGIAQGFAAGAQQRGADKRRLGELRKYSVVTDISSQAAASGRKAVQDRKYIRPEDYLMENVNPLGSGTNYLAAENGIEVQNTYAPDVLYTDLGYEPLDDSNKVKAYKKGGKLKKAQAGIVEAANVVADISRASGQLGAQAGSQLFGTHGQTGGYSTALSSLGFAGGLLGAALDAPLLKKLEKSQSQVDANLQAAAFNQSNAFTPYAENGASVQPQLIKYFGEDSLADLLKPDPTMNTLRSGGHLKNYAAPSEYAMETGRAQLAMGGDLAVYRGEAETISDNPYTGETVMFRGPSHDDGGMPIKYGGNPVEVEGGEPAMVMEDGGKQENLVVFGNMNIPDYAANEIGDKKAKGMKFKNYIAKLSKEESKQTKVSEKGITMINDSNPGDKFDQLSMNTGMAMLEGSNMKLKSLANKKNNAAAVQSAILDTAEEMGMDSAELSKRNVAKFGGKFTSAPIAQDGIEVGGITLNRPLEDQYPLTEDQMIKTTGLQDVTVFPTKLEQLRNKIRNEVTDIKKNKTSNSDWMTAATIASQSLSPFLNKVRNPLDPAQLAPEMYALATNQMQPVQMQQYQPILTQPISISLQDQLNEIDAQARAAYKLSGQNPAAAAQIAAQSAQAKTKVLGEEFRLNQAEKLRAQQANAASLNDAMLKNLALMDQQYVRQATAESKTKAQTFEALKSIADKTAQNKLERIQLQTAQNMYPAFKFTSEGVAYKDPTYLASLNQYGSREVNNRFPAPPTGTSVKDYTLDKDTRQWIPKTASVEAKNGSIVKSLKNF